MYKWTSSDIFGTKSIRDMDDSYLLFGEMYVAYVGMSVIICGANISSRRGVVRLGG